MTNFRNKIASISFWLSILMVFYHTLRPIKVSTDSSLLKLWTSIEIFIHSLGAICVPFFFVISGYLFFRTFKLADYCKKLNSRWRSLFIPYIIWNILATLQIYFAEKWGFIAGEPRTIINWFIGTINADYSILWYIKYLLYFAILSPTIYYFCKTKARALITFAGISFASAYCLITGKLSVPIPVSANTLPDFCYNIQYFLVGTIAVLHFRGFVEYPPKRIKIFAWIGVLIFLIIRAFNLSYSLAITQWIFIFVVAATWFALDSFKFMTTNRFVGLSFLYIAFTLYYISPYSPYFKSRVKTLYFNTL